MLQQLMADALRCEPERAAPLAQLVHEKTAGNPFFAIQFISSLAEEGMLTFDHDAARWSWDLDRIHAKGYTDNLVDLMVGKLTRLTAETQQAVQQLACLGNAAAVATLSLVYGTTETEIHLVLEEAVRARLAWSGENDSYHFIHDRIQEAAYQLVPESNAPRGASAHRTAARGAHAAGAARRRRSSRSSISSTAARALISVRSGTRATGRAELDRGQARESCDGVRLRPELSGQGRGAAARGLAGRERYPLVFAMEISRAECEFLTGDLAAAEERLATLSLPRCESRGQGRCRVLASSSLHNARSLRARCRDLRRIPARGGRRLLAAPDGRGSQRQSTSASWRWLGGRPIEALFDLPLMSDPRLASHDGSPHGARQSSAFHVDCESVVPCPAASGEPERSSTAIAMGRATPMRVMMQSSAAGSATIEQVSASASSVSSWSKRRASIGSKLACTSACGARGYSVGTRMFERAPCYFVVPWRSHCETGDQHVCSLCAIQAHREPSHQRGSTRRGPARSRVCARIREANTFRRDGRHCDGAARFHSKPQGIDAGVRLAW